MKELEWSCPVSEALFAEARQLMPGGVNSPVRAFKSVDMNPPFMVSGQGCYLTDEDGHTYIDYVGSWGPLILGHRYPSVIASLEDCLRQTGTSFGAPTRLENRLAAMIVEAVPGIEMVRMVNSGTEAVMSALRLARAYTGREKIVKLAGCYHGHADPMLIQAGSGALTHGVPNSPGVPSRTAEDTIVLPYNDLTAAADCFAAYGAQIAAVIVEPVAGNMGCILPHAGFLSLLRELTSRSGSLLIFDEVITGFRVAYGGAQAYFKVIPDLTVLGKIIGGGLPVGAYGGRKEIMEQVAPQGPVYQAGTLSGNPLAMTAGIATLEALQNPSIYEELEAKRTYLTEALQKAAAQHRVHLTVNSVASMFTLFFTSEPVTDLTSAEKCDRAIFKRFFKLMLQQGIYFGPSPFETSFVSLAHSQKDLDQTVAAAEAAFSELQSN